MINYLKQLSLAQRLAVIGISALIIGLNVIIDFQQQPQQPAEQSNVAPTP